MKRFHDGLTTEQRAYRDYKLWCAWMDIMPADLETWRKETATPERK